jgi:RimJ/RimL family protein N-acetyltransferase
MRTHRLTLRFVNDDDVDPLTEYRNDPAVAALQDWDLPYPKERARSLIALHRGLSDYQAGRGHQVAIEMDGRLVGDVYVGLDEHAAIADIGFSLTPAAQGRGVAYEAVNALVADLIQRRGVHRVVAELSKDNHASARLLERLGMQFEALTVRSFWWRGRWDDNLYYSMTDEQWRASRCTTPSGGWWPGSPIPTPTRTSGVPDRAPTWSRCFAESRPTVSRPVS